MEAGAVPGDPGEVWCIVVAAGSGRRFGGAKQHAVISDRSVLDHALDAPRATCDGVVICVAGDDDLLAPGAAPRGVSHVVEGGPTRSASVACGLAAVPPEAGVVLVHDAARPLATPALFARVIAAVRGGADAAVPVVAVVDTIRLVDGGTVDRDRLRAVQTPQGFRSDVLRRAHSGASEATDDASLVEASGGVVVLVEGERTNLKITGPTDLDVVRVLMERNRSTDGRIGP